MKPARPSTMETVERGYRALSENDWEALGELLAPDMELVRAEGLGNVDGAASVLAFTRPDAFEWQVFEPRAGITESGEKVLVPLEVRARGTGSEIEVAQDFFHVVTLRAGRIQRVAVYTDRDEAVGDLQAP